LEIQYLLHSSKPKLPEEYLKSKATGVVSTPGLGTQVIKSAASDVSTYVNFKNNSSFVCEVFWIDFEGNEVLYNTLNPGDSYRQETYVEHPWVARDVKTRDFMLVNGTRLFFPDAEETIGVITGEQRAEVLSAKSSDDSENYVFISYEYDNIELARQIASSLNEKGIPTVVDEQGDAESRAKHIEKAKVICPIMTQKYENSKKHSKN